MDDNWEIPSAPPPRSKPVPMARQPCPGSNRQVEVTRWPKGLKIACTHCSLKLEGKPKTYDGDRHPTTGRLRQYMVLPNHTGVGTKQAEKIDWSQM